LAKKEKILQLVIRPFIKFLMNKGMKYGQIDDLIQRVIVEEAEREVRSVNNNISASKITLVSGIHRSKVKEIIESNVLESELKASMLSKVLGSWSSQPEYLDNKGNPKMLSTVGNESEFSKLVTSVTKQISPYTVLFELKRINSVEIVEDKIKLILPEYWTGHSPEETYLLVSRNIENLLNAVEENLKSDANTAHQLHLTTEYDNISEEKMTEIKEWFIKKGDQFHKEARDFLSKFDKDINPDLKGEAGAKVSVTTFSFSAPKSEIPQIKPNKRGRKKKNV
jgi:hypothetical protein